MTKNRVGNFFEDFRTGQSFKHGVPRTLSDGDRALYIGLTGSRSALSTAAPTAMSLGMPGAPLEDLLVFNVVFGKSVPDLSTNAVANLGYADMRFVAPVFAGDTISVESEVLGVKENSNGRSGVVYVRSIGRNQRSEPVLSYVRWVMIHKRDPGTKSPSNGGELPQLPNHVDAAQLSVPTFMHPESVAHATACNDLWENYSVDERIVHPGAMTINDSDHSIAARLYQNTARPHFDARTMASQPAGQRLVYGGHVMSVCRSLSYDGLENGLGIAAINGGSHVNPVFAGDTIRCATQVLESYELGESAVGALRLRMIGAKNIDSASEIVFPPRGTSRPEHSKQVVLDLDYTVLIPKQSKGDHK
ncbi:2-methylfumaryl-CoA hydratase [Nitrobacteraceae bacterium AZCC 2161]